MMKLTKIAKILMVSAVIVSLSACSSMKKRDGSGGMGDASVEGAQSFGAGDVNAYGADVSRMTPEQLLAKRTYYFDFDRSEVKETEKPAILANADNLVAHPNAKVLLEGHTDPRGSREYNVALGERRANSVADTMRTKGVNPDQVRIISYGAERLAVPGHTEEDFKQDRRAVLNYLQH